MPAQCAIENSAGRRSEAVFGCGKIICMSDAEKRCALHRGAVD
jgi:hypothetical protein